MSYHPGGSLTLGPKEREVLVLVADLTRDLGRAPTVGQVAAALSLLRGLDVSGGRIAVPELYENTQVGLSRSLRELRRLQARRRQRRPRASGK